MDVQYLTTYSTGSALLGTLFGFSFIACIVAIISMIISLRGTREFVERKLVSVPFIGFVALLLYLSNSSILGYLLKGGSPGRSISRLSMFTSLMQAIVEISCLVAIAGITKQTARYRMRSYDRGGTTSLVLFMASIGLFCTFVVYWAFQIKCGNYMDGNCWSDHWGTIKRAYLAHCIIHATTSLTLIILTLNALLSTPLIMASLTFSVVALCLWFLDSLFMALHYGVEVFGEPPYSTSTRRFVAATSVLHVIFPTMAIIIMALACDAAKNIDMANLPRQPTGYVDEESNQRKILDRNDTMGNSRDPNKESTRELAKEQPRDQTRDLGRDTLRETPREQART